jgi:hypothetical protein
MYPSSMKCEPYEWRKANVYLCDPFYPVNGAEYGIGEMNLGSLGNKGMAGKMRGFASLASLTAWNGPHSSAEDAAICRGTDKRNEPNLRLATRKVCGLRRLFRPQRPRPHIPTPCPVLATFGSTSLRLVLFLGNALFLGNGCLPNSILCGLPSQIYSWITRSRLRDLPLNYDFLP